MTEPPDELEPPEQQEETPEQLAARQQRANRATRGALAGVLCLEALVVLLMPRALAQTSGGLGTSKTVTLIVLAVILVMAGFLLRRRWGIGTGSVLQVAYLATGIWLPVAIIPAVLLVGSWLYLLNLRTQVAGTPGGARMLIS
jgi:ABC-type transport system involved in cytochrome bd biosynthesis fused ATPase/permease subunit